MSKTQGGFKRIISMILSLTIILSVVQIPVFASGNAIYLPQDEISEEILASGEFYLGTHAVEIQENSEAPYLLKVGRGGDELPEAEVRLNMLDITAKYGDDYVVKVHNGSVFGEKVKNSFSSSSFLEQIIEGDEEIVEENTTDILVSGEEIDPDEFNELFQEDLELLDNYLADTVEGYETESQNEDTPSKNSLKSAKELATGLKSDKTPMDGGNNSLENYVDEMLSTLSLELESAYLIISFEAGETEKYIEIIPKDNNSGDGDRIFSVNLFAVSENASISQNSSMSVSIIDDEIQTPATVSFTESYYYPEDGYIRVTLERTGAINQMVSVNLKTEDLTATKAEDYSQVDTSVVFPYGVTKRTINIPIRSEYVEGSAEFEIVISNPINCDIGEIGTAYGVIMDSSVSFRLFAASDNESSSVSRSKADANSLSYFTGEPFDIANTYSARVSSNAKSESYVKVAEEEEIEIYTKANTTGAYSEISWNIGDRYDISGLAIDWTKESGKPCYTETFVYGRVGNRNEELWSSSTERWERRTTNLLFPHDKSSDYIIKQIRSGGFLGKSPTLKIHSIKPILRPFEITLKGAEPIKFLNENGEYVDNTTMAEVADANNALLRNATNTGTGTVVKFSGDSFTVTSNSKYSYIKGLKIVNEETGDSKIIKDNLAPGTTSVSVKLENDFLKDNLEYINFYENQGNSVNSDNQTPGRKGKFAIQPIMERYDSVVKIHNDYRGTITYTGNPEVTEATDGTILTYHKGDKIRFTQTLNPDYASSYTGSRIRIVTKDNSTSDPVDNKRAYDKDTNYCTLLNTYSSIDVYPNFDKKENHIIVRVLKSDLEKFNTGTGIFAYEGVEVGEYMEYTVVESDKFAAGIYYEFAARAKENGYTPVWQKINTDVKYSQSTFYFESQDEIEENIIYLTCQKADDMGYSLTGNAYYSNVSLKGGKEGVAWMPASSVYVMIGSESFGLSDDDGKISTAGMYGINGMNVIYKIVASGKTEYKTTVLSNKKISKFGSSGVQIEAYDVNIGTIKAAASDVSSPYVTAVVATNSENVESGYISINDEVTTFMVAISNNGAEYFDADGTPRIENVIAVDLLVYDGNSHQLKTEITGARKVSDVGGMSIWNFSTSFRKGESEDYAASDELYVRLTTDKVIGNGKGYNENGELVELDSLKQTLHAPLNTGYTFVESNRIDPVKQDLIMDTNMNFIELPFIGGMVSSFNIKKFNFNVSTLPNGGLRLSIGRLSNPGEEFKPDNGQDYEWDDLKSAVDDLKNGGNKSKDKSRFGSAKWGLSPLYGAFFDFGIKNVYYNDNVTQKFVFCGAGFYLGITGNFRATHYFILGGVPFYVGANGELTFFGEVGFTPLNEDTATADSLLTKNNAIEEDYSPTVAIRANGNVNGFAGVGLCNTLGVRFGLAFYANYIFNPSVWVTHPDYDANGLILSVNLKAWVDAFFFTIPSPCITFVEKKFGYYKNVEDSEKAELELMSVNEQGQTIITKTRNSSDSEWMPSENGPMLRGAFKPETSTVLLENGYDRADSQLLDIGDGRIMLAFVADDSTRPDEERTALMYSIYENGSWSEPVKVQDDGTADFEPDICDAGDKVHITWTSRAPGVGYSSETEFLKNLDVYTTTLDKRTLTIGEIERLTDDEFYDSNPTGLYDEASGDYIVYYLKADVSEDFVKSMSPTTNESVIVYMLYDAKEGTWARDYYYDNEVESEEAEDFLVEYWGGQRFLASPIEDFGMNDPIIIDFDSISYNNLGVYTYTVDEDNNIDTDQDRELFVQIYDFEDHATYVPVRITNDNITDARPQLVRNGEHTYLFWLQNNRDIRYIDVTQLIKEGVNDDGSIKEDYELSKGVVFYAPSIGSDVTPTFGSYNAFVDKDDNLYVTWLQPVTNADGSSCQEVFASALIKHGCENTSWSEGVRLTNSGAFNDEVAFVTDSNGDLLTVGNQYTMNLDDENYGVDNVKLVATKFKTVGSMDVNNVEYSNNAPEAGSETTVTVKIKNTGLKTAKGYTLKVYEMKNGAIGDEVHSVTSETEVAASASSYVTFDWTMPESYEGIDELSLYMEVQEAETTDLHTYTSEAIKINPVYEIVDYSVEERDDGFYATYTLKNIGNKDARPDDKVVIKFNDIYNKNIEAEPYLETAVGELKINEVKTWVKPLEIDEKHLEFGYTNAYIDVRDKNDDSLSTCQAFMITSDKPHNIIVNGDENLSEIRLKEGDSLKLSVESYTYGDMKFNVADEEIASIKDSNLVADKAGETELIVTAEPYEVSKTLKVVVEKKKTSSGGSGGAGAKYTITFNTDGGNKIDPIKVDKNSVIGKVETPVKEGFTFDGWYLDKELTKKADLDAKITSNVTLYAKWVEKVVSVEWKNPFADVKSDDWFYESVRYANANGLFSGTAEDTFSPNEELTRAMLVTVLYRAEGEPKTDKTSKFKDVLKDSYYEEAVSWAQENGIISGVSKDEFAPDSKITREQIATIMYRYAVYKGIEAVTLEENLAFKDAGDISEYAVSAMNWITGQEIIKGYEDNTVKPKNNATRAEATALIQRFLEKVKSIEKN